MHVIEILWLLTHSLGRLHYILIYDPAETSFPLYKHKHSTLQSTTIQVLKANIHSKFHIRLARLKTSQELRKLPVTSYTESQD